MRIASVEDDRDQLALIGQLMEDAGHTYTGFQTAAALLLTDPAQSFDLLLVDWQLPDTTGCELVRTLRGEPGGTLPILFLTARADEADIVAGLAAGADDYLIKPARPAELVARVNALLRRAYPDMTQPADIIRAGEFVLNPSSKNVLLRGERVSLSPREFALATFLFQNIGQMVSRDAVENAVWGRTAGLGSRTLDTHMYRLRTKLALRPENGVRLTSVYSHGYRLEKAEADGVVQALN